MFCNKAFWSRCRSKTSKLCRKVRHYFAGRLEQALGGAHSPLRARQRRRRFCLETIPTRKGLRVPPLPDFGAYASSPLSPVVKIQPSGRRDVHHCTRRQRRGHVVGHHTPTTGQVLDF